MCLKLKEGNTKLIVADKDIVCYKILLQYPDGTYHSPYQRLPYELNKLMCDSVNVWKYRSDKTWNVGAGGFHTFAKFDEVKKAFDENFSDGLYPGFNPVIVKCFIPKGTKYYYGSFSFLFCAEKYESYASKKLMVTDEVIKRQKNTLAQ